MIMNQITALHQAFFTYLTTQLGVSLVVAKRCSFDLNTDDQKQQFGDISSNAAMLLSKELQRNPREIAQEIAQNFTDPAIEKLEVAGPGFLNIFLTKKAFAQLAQELFEQKQTFFKPDATRDSKINIEFVSANPTGPLHFGHGRGGIIGDVLSNVLTFLGNEVTKEFYINDAGLQMQKLGQSLKIRYQQKAGMDSALPEDAYHGTYLIDLANRLFADHGKKLLDQPDEFFTTYASTKLLEHIQKTLQDYGIQFDEWFSEQTLHQGAIEQILAILKQKEHLHEKDGALWFTSTKFGDDKDRVVKKQDGTLTYAAADIAYMQDKINRGHNQLIYILGHDHHSYATRLHSMRKALGLEKNPLDVILYQLVSMKESGKTVRMSKRKGKIVTLQDVIDTVGPDVARFFYLNRKADAQLEFNVDLALTNTDENPVFYIQYAYVRTGSILQKADAEQPLQDITAQDLEHLSQADNLLIKQVVLLKEMLETIEFNHQTHLLAYYTYELAQCFNRYYGKNKVINLQDVPLSRARLALTQIVRTTLSLCLDLLGISTPERM
ncbi:arginine--tRNA ligase [Candidatus Dependentiae bacterium]|nr:MAG: arginine--tRNA ligase [Candidatus Dependentiae bacterium]